jgi:hypothetical protein
MSINGAISCSQYNFIFNHVRKKRVKSGGKRFEPGPRSGLALEITTLIVDNFHVVFTTSYLCFYYEILSSFLKCTHFESLDSVIPERMK